MTASTPCTLSNPTNFLENMLQSTCAKTPNRSTFRTSMSSPMPSQPFGTYMVQQVSRPRPCGSRPSPGAIISPGRSSTSTHVAKFFPASKETQKGHMHGQRQGVCSTEVAEPTKDLPTTLPHQNDILIKPRGEIPHVRQPNRLVPGRLKPGQQVCHDPTPRQQQLIVVQSNARPVQR